MIHMSVLSDSTKTENEQNTEYLKMVKYKWKDKTLKARKTHAQYHFKTSYESLASWKQHVKKWGVAQHFSTIL